MASRRRVGQQRQNDEDFERNWKLGRHAEMRIGKWLRAQGWWVYPVYEFSGLEVAAPKLKTADPNDALIAPDLFCVRGGSSKWVEVKFKTRFTRHEYTSVNETGFSLEHYSHYQVVQMQSDCPVEVVFVHKSEDEVKWAALSRLSELARKYLGMKMGPGEMVFFPYRELPTVLRTSELPVVAQEEVDALGNLARAEELVRRMPEFEFEELRRRYYASRQSGP